MDSLAVTVPLRPPTKKMKKRKELDALAPPHAVSRRSSGKRSSQELLSDSSDERSEYWNVSTSRSSSRKARSREASRGACLGLLRACSVFLGGTAVLVTAVLIWLFIDVGQQLTVLRAELDEVIAGSEGVPDALQMCHTLDRNFKTNITLISDEIQKINRSLNSYSEQMLNIQQELQQVQISLKSAPELTSVPSTVKALQNSIGNLEIDIHELQIKYETLKNSTSVLQQSQENQKNSLTMLENTLSNLSNTTQQPQKETSNETFIENEKLWNAIAQLKNNLSHINQTLSINMTWAQEDLAEDHKKVVSLLDMAQNTSAQILTLQQECVKKKDQEILHNLIQSLSDQVDKLSNSKNNRERQQQMKPRYNASKNATNTLMSIVSETRNQNQLGNKVNDKPSAQSRIGNFETSTATSYNTSEIQRIPSTSSTSIPGDLPLDKI